MRSWCGFELRESYSIGGRYGGHPCPPLWILTIRHNGVNLLLGCAMCWKRYHKLTVGLLTQTASGAGNFTRMQCCGTSYNLSPVGCCKESAGFFRVNNCHGGNAMLTHYAVSIIHRLTGCVDGETLTIRPLKNSNVCFIQQVMSIGKTFLAFVCIN